MPQRKRKCRQTPGAQPQDNADVKRARHYGAERPSEGRQLLELPREIRDMIWGFVVQSCTQWNRGLPGTMPMPTDEWSAKRLRDTSIKRLRGDPIMFDNSLLRVNNQIYNEATQAILRVNTIRISDATIRGGLATRDAMVKRRLEYILTRAKTLDVELYSPNRFVWTSWYIRILTSRTNLDRLFVSLADRMSEFVTRWISDEASAKKELEDILDRFVGQRNAIVRYRSFGLSGKYSPYHMQALSGAIND